MQTLPYGNIANVLLNFYKYNIQAVTFAKVLIFYLKKIYKNCLFVSFKFLQTEY